MPDGIHEDSDETDDVIDQEDPDEADEEMDEDDIDEDDIAIMEKDLRSQTDLMIEMQQKLLDELRRKERARRERLGIATGEDLTDMDQYLELSFSYDLGLSPSPSDPDEPLIARYERLNEIVLEQASILTGWFRQVESMEEKDRQEEAERATNQTSAVDSVHETPQ
ncbi:MAG: hypothetical protein LQ350_008566 [Teloschistes chrysophthalmus]|nr:MAG: hypothetical protein LQ350_008566 [Niorma chrysophthalma]